MSKAHNTQDSIILINHNSRRYPKLFTNTFGDTLHQNYDQATTMQTITAFRALHPVFITALPLTVPSSHQQPGNPLRPQQNQRLHQIQP